MKKEEKTVRMYKLANGNAIGLELINNEFVMVGQTINGNALVTTEMAFTVEGALKLAELIEKRCEEEVDRHNAEAVKRMEKLNQVLKNAFNGQFDIEFIPMDMPCTNGFHFGNVPSTNMKTKEGCKCNRKTNKPTKK